MAAILVDYENVNGSNGLKGADALCADDTLIIFYSNCCGKIRCDYLQDIKDSGCEFRVVKLKGSGKNALDFYIAAECGIISERGEKKIGIISNDKGFQAVIDFFCVNRDVARGIEKCKCILYISGFHNLRFRGIWRRKMLQNRMSTLDLAAECARIEERNKMRKELEGILEGTEYEERTAEIIDFMESKKLQGKKELYTGSLHSFGQKDGRVIYHLIKNHLSDIGSNKK